MRIIIKRKKKVKAEKQPQPQKNNTKPKKEEKPKKASPKKKEKKKISHHPSKRKYNSKDLSNFSIIIPFRYTKLREKLLYKVLEFLTKNFNAEIIIAEHDYKQNTNKEDIEKKFNVKYFFIKAKKDELFDRTGCLNFLIQKTSTQVVFNHDSDCILDPSCYLLAKDLILANKYDVVIPYCGEGFNVSENFEMNGSDENILYLRWECARGGIIAIDREKYIKAGMENPKIKSWGFEDFERIYRFSKLRYRICATKLPEVSHFSEKFFKKKYLYHFDHDSDRDENSNKNPHIESNEKISNKIRSMSRASLQKEIDSWTGKNKPEAQFKFK